MSPLMGGGDFEPIDPRIGPLGGDIRDLREALGLSLRQAAKLCRLSDVDMGRVERRVVPTNVFQFSTMVRQLLAPTRARKRRSARKLASKIIASWGDGGAGLDANGKESNP